MLVVFAILYALLLTCANIVATWHGKSSYPTESLVFLFSSSLELANAVSLPLSLVEVSYRVFGDDINIPGD